VKNREESERLSHARWRIAKEGGRIRAAMMKSGCGVLTVIPMGYAGSVER